jgi:hypothetical protein
LDPKVLYTLSKTEHVAVAVSSSEGDVSMSRQLEELSPEEIERIKLISTINWKVVDRWRDKFGYKSNDEMVWDWMFNQDEIFSRGLKKKPYPFHRHVRLNLDKMAFTGVTDVQSVIDQGLKLTSAQMKQLKESMLDDEDVEQDDE